MTLSYQIFIPHKEVVRYGLMLPDEANQIPKNLTTINQTHENDDALITDQHGAPLGIRIADCQSILLFDPKKRVIANIHAGWRGLALGVIENTLSKMQKNFACSPENMLAAISPSIGPCCFCMTDPKKELPEEFHPFIVKKRFVDLWKISQTILEKLGIFRLNIENPMLCTLCHADQFPSHRKGDTRRMISYIELI